MNVINLTTGLEFLPEVAPDCFSRLQSSHLEGKHWQRFLDGVDANIWYALARGEEVTIFDCGSRRNDGVSRVIWQGLPFLQYAAEACWGLDVSKAYFKQNRVCEYLRTVYTSLDKRGLRYFRKHVSTKAVHLRGVSKPSLLDGREK